MPIILSQIGTDLVSLAEAKIFLNISGTQYDLELPTFITTATDLIIGRIGPVAGAPVYDEWYDGGSTQILLRHSPVQSITSVTESYGGATFFALSPVVLDSGLPMDSYGYTVDLSNGLLTRRAAGVTMAFAGGVMNIHVVYVGGYTTIPAELKTAANLLIKHLWAERRGGSKRPGLGGDDVPGRDEGDFPARVEEILANFYVPGIG